MIFSEQRIYMVFFNLYLEPKISYFCFQNKVGRGKIQKNGA